MTLLGSGDVSWGGLCDGGWGVGGISLGGVSEHSVRMMLLEKNWFMVGTGLFVCYLC